MTQRTENEHVAAILSAVDAISDAVIAAGRTDIPMVGDHYDAILHHADAMVAQLAEAEARADRWRDAFLTFWGDNTGPGDDIPDLGHLGLEASDWPNTDGGDES